MYNKKQKRILVFLFSDHKQNFNSYIVEDFNNFILIGTELNSPKENWAKILYNVSLKNIEAVIDRSEPLILIIGIKDIPSDSKVCKIVFLIIFFV